MWTKSSFSANVACVEVEDILRWENTERWDTLAQTHPKMHVINRAFLMRDSKNPDTVLVFDPDEWRAFLLGVRDGEFDLEGQP